MRSRRLCLSPLHQGPRWLLIMEFHVKVWGDEGKTWVAQYQSFCKTCDRIRARDRKARERGRDEPYGQRQPGRTREMLLVHRRARHKERMRTDPEYAARHRASNREVATFKRRAKGVQPRVYRTERGDDSRVYVDAAPFLVWMDEWLAITGRTRREICRKAAGTADDASSLERAIGRWKTGIQADLRVIDRLVVAMGMPDQLSVFYPLADKQQAA